MAPSLWQGGHTVGDRSGFTRLQWVVDLVWECGSRGAWSRSGLAGRTGKKSVCIGPVDGKYVITRMSLWICLLPIIVNKIYYTLHSIHG